MQGTSGRRGHESRRSVAVSDHVRQLSDRAAQIQAKINSLESELRRVQEEAEIKAEEEFELRKQWLVERAEHLLDLVPACGHNDLKDEFDEGCVCCVLSRAREFKYWDSDRDLVIELRRRELPF